jgi:hypothetical protein
MLTLQSRRAHGKYAAAAMCIRWGGVEFHPKVIQKEPGFASCNDPLFVRISG